MIIIMCRQLMALFVEVVGSVELSPEDAKRRVGMTVRTFVRSTREEFFDKFRLVSEELNGKEQEVRVAGGRGRTNCVISYPEDEGSFTPC